MAKRVNFSKTEIAALSAIYEKETVKYEMHFFSSKIFCAACGRGEGEDDEEEIQGFPSRPDWHLQPSYCGPHLRLL